MPSNKKSAAAAAAKKGALGTVKRAAKKIIPKIAKGAARATGAAGIALNKTGRLVKNRKSIYKKK